MPERKNDSFYHDVFFNGEIVGEADGMWNNDGRFYHIDFELKVLNLFKNFNLMYLFGDNLDSFSLPVDINKFHNLDWIDINKSSIWFNYEDFNATIYLSPDFLKWSKPISLLTLIEKLNVTLTEKGLTEKINDEDILEIGIYLKFSSNFNYNISYEYNRILTILNNEIADIVEENNRELNKNHLVNIFSFPPEIRQACEQYLIYFSKFLEDLGIDTTVKLDAQTKNTFFTVIPKNSNDALFKIKELLDIYISLVDEPNLEMVSYTEYDLSINQLLSNVYHLKSQLVLLNSILQAKDATIESLKFTNYQQTLLIELNSKKNEEKVLDGMLTINEFQGKGFKINLPEILRRLKRRF